MLFLKTFFTVFFHLLLWALELEVTCSNSWNNTVLFLLLHVCCILSIERQQMVRNKLYIHGLNKRNCCSFFSTIWKTNKNEPRSIVIKYFIRFITEVPSWWRKYALPCSCHSRSRSANKWKIKWNMALATSFPCQTGGWASHCYQCCSQWCASLSESITCFIWAKAFFKGISLNLWSRGGCFHTGGEENSSSPMQWRMTIEAVLVKERAVCEVTTTTHISGCFVFHGCWLL